jgi:hypothetical protein
MINIIVSSATPYYTLPVFVESNTACGAVVHSVVLSTNTPIDTTIITFDSTTMQLTVVATSMPVSHTEYTLLLKAV